MQPEKCWNPDGKCDWGYLVFSSITIPGDERSRTNPGHGYPEHTESTVQYIIFKYENDWKNEITRRTIASQVFVPLVVHRPKVSTRVVVELK